LIVVVKLKLLFLISKWLVLLLLPPSIVWHGQLLPATLLQSPATTFGNALACCRQHLLCRRSNTCCAAAATADARLQLHAATLLPPTLDHCSPALPVSFAHYHQLIVAFNL